MLLQAGTLASRVEAEPRRIAEGEILNLKREIANATLLDLTRGLIGVLHKSITNIRFSDRSLCDFHPVG
ncbi:hypothetical protein PY650_32885 [Rhizobium calliandrae]|uniref:Uncharacterized protein n=1 Tax=Rhizobium calliandrae TaxID=1312182 RepID=A0ABT7KQ96_9HYPH|nr:hypothetical protein [Rhizobium calliandrae]MDL2410312.1 hypothetical protein [Rhizobium calliandrae]